MRAKQVTGDEFWLRCVFCGDSPNHLLKTHFSVNLRTGYYHCYRCCAGGKLQPKLLLRLVEEAGVSPLTIIGGSPQLTLEDALDNLIPGPATQRRSALDRYHVDGFRDRVWDAFIMTNLRGDQVGVLLRAADGEKAAYIVGARGLLVPGGRPLSSSPSDPYTVVEGPYDVLSPRDVGVGGFLSRSHLADYMRGQFVNLCPDGDVWANHGHMLIFSTAVQGLFKSTRGPWPVSIDYIAGGLDPDEVPPNQRERIATVKFLQRVRQLGLLLQYNV